MAPVKSEPGEYTPDEDRLDSEAIRRLLVGDERAFDELVERYTAPIYSLSYRMLGSAEAAEDAVQDIFTKVYRNAARFDPRRRFFSWLYTIALNHLRSQHRSRRRQFNTQAVEFDEQRGNPEGPTAHPEEELKRRREYLPKYAWG
jgi:RNA polymerase sigma-70 factor (ECF subfamily)